MKRSVWVALMSATILSVVGILVAVFMDTEDANLGIGDPLIPNLEQRISELQEIIIAFPSDDPDSPTDTGSGVETTELNFWKDDAHWRIREHHNYHADVAQLNTLIVGLLDMNLKEPKTRVHDRHERLGLGAPEEGGSATRIGLYGVGGAVIAEILLGNAAISRSGQYVRHLGNDQTWLAGPTLEERLSDDAVNWTARPLLEIPVDMVRTVTFIDSRAKEHRLNRDLIADPFTITPPEGMKVTNPAQLEDWAKLLEELSYQNVLPVPDDDVDSAFQTEQTVRVETIEGYTVTARIGNSSLSDNTVLHLSFSVSESESVDADESISEIVSDYNADYSNWLYELNEEQQQAFFFDADSVFSEIADVEPKEPVPEK